MTAIDLNSDLGESFGVWTMGRDTDVLPYITSASVACGFHAGDPAVMRRTVAAAVSHRVAIGAHPGLPDVAGFGRREMRISAQEAYDLTVYQVGALMAVAASQGARVAHVKPHGALYNMAAADERLADAIARAVHDVDASLALFGLAGSALIAAGENRGLLTLSEGFPDRGYADDGSLLPRAHPGALVNDPAEAAERAVRMAEKGGIDTLCIHGDGPRAPEIAKAIREALDTAGVSVAAPTPVSSPPTR
jgi:5-oxoprolinase (ATP-hydrolysing) subunit A